MACSLLILLWVMHEKGINTWHANSDRLYTIYEQQYHDGQVDGYYSTPAVLPDEIKKIIPEIEMSSGYAWNNLSTFQAGDKIIKERGNNASPDFFSMFSFPLLEGNAKTALNSPLSIAISRKMAADLFGDPKQAIGQPCDMKIGRILK
jgi:hypothetical protein